MTDEDVKRAFVEFVGKAVYEKMERERVMEIRYGGEGAAVVDTLRLSGAEFDRPKFEPGPARVAVGVEGGRWIGMRIAPEAIYMRDTPEGIGA